MSSLSLRHPEDGQLLQYLDGELGRRQSRAIQGHLKACWECRAELEGLQATVNDCVRYRKQVLIPHLPAPPAAWGGLDFARVDAELAGNRSHRALAPLVFAAAQRAACGGRFRALWRWRWGW